MSRRFPGFFRGLGATSHPDLMVTSRPRIDVGVFLGKSRLRVPFLIDTGADLTILQPSHAGRVLRASGQPLPPTKPIDHLSISGIGSSAELAVVRRVGLLFVDDESDGYWFSQSILFADDTSGQPWRVPSILGRDVLQRFELNLSYDPPSVSLTLNA